jgi:S1-C subfamily serine protease
VIKKIAHKTKAATWFSFKKITKLALISLALIVTVKVSTEMYKFYIRQRMALATRQVVIPKVGTGTGFYVNTKRGPLLMTAAHVCDGSSRYNIVDGSFAYAGRLVLISKQFDLCLIQTNEKNPVTLNMGTELAIGETIYTMGYPLGAPRSFGTGEFTSPVVSETLVGYICPKNEPDSEDGPTCAKVLGKEQITYKKCRSRGTRYLLKSALQVFIFQVPATACIERTTVNMTTLPAWPGSSGSAAVNVYGNVIGVLVQARSDLNWGLLVPTADVIKFLNEELK